MLYTQLLTDAPIVVHKRQKKNKNNKKKDEDEDMGKPFMLNCLSPLPLLSPSIAPCPRFFFL